MALDNYYKTATEMAMIENQKENSLMFKIASWFKKESLTVEERLKNIEGAIFKKREQSIWASLSIFAEPNTPHERIDLLDNRLKAMERLMDKMGYASEWSDAKESQLDWHKKSKKK